MESLKLKAARKTKHKEMQANGTIGADEIQKEQVEQMELQT